MSSLYAQYIQEYANRGIIEDSDSFTTYDIFKSGNISSLKIKDMFIKKEARCKNKSHDLLMKAEKIARDEGCTIISAQIEKSASEFVQQRSAHILRLFGMEKSYEDNSYIIYSRSVR